MPTFSPVLLEVFSFMTSSACIAWSHPVGDNAFVYCVSAKLTTFNSPLTSSGPRIHTLAAQLYDRLMDADPATCQLTPALATGWERRDNRCGWRLYLCPDVNFPCTGGFTPTLPQMHADDVVLSLARLLVHLYPRHRVGGVRYPCFDSLALPDTVKSISRLIDDTVEVQLNSPDVSFLWHLATCYAPVLSAAESASALGASTTCRYGAFFSQRLSCGTVHSPGQARFVLERSPRMNQMIIESCDGSMERVHRLLTGECDSLAYPAVRQRSLMRADPVLTVLLRPGMNDVFLAFNPRKPPLGRPEVRQALAITINKQRLNLPIYYDRAETAAELLPRGSLAYDKDAPVTDYNTHNDRDRLRKLAIEQREMTLRVQSAPQAWDPGPLKTAALIQPDLPAAGVQVDIIRIDVHIHETRLSTLKHDSILTDLAKDSNEHNSIRHPLSGCAAGNARHRFSHWCNPEFDNMQQQARQSQPLFERIGDHHQTQRILAEQLPVLPLALASSLRLEARRHAIQGLVLCPFGTAAFTKVYREKSMEKK